MRRKNKRWSNINETISATFSSIGLNKKVQQYRLWKMWNSIVGSNIASNASPSIWRGNMLVINVKHAAWMQELSYLKAELMEKIKKAIPDLKIKDIRFEIGDIEKTAIAGIERELTLEKIPLTAEEEEFIDTVVNEIKDDKIKDIVRNIMTCDFTRKRMKKEKV